MDEYIADITRGPGVVAPTIADPGVFFKIYPVMMDSECICILRIMDILNENIEFARKYFIPKHSKLSSTIVKSECYGTIIRVIIQENLRGELLDITYANFAEMIPDCVALKPREKCNHGDSRFCYTFYFGTEYEGSSSWICMDNEFDHKKYGFVESATKTLQYIRRKENYNPKTMMLI